jgi:CheY-like chemotaxis protein
MRTSASILVVEDDPTISRLLHDIFTLTGSDVHLATTAAAAAASLTRSRPDLMTLDLSLPGISGQTLLERLHSQPQLRNLPVIVITSHLPVAPSIHELASAVIEKPFDLEELLSVANRVADTSLSLAA